ncbi:MAG: response regulator [Anaerolineae bacterium]|nr:response regulator [Anaerolineae bacterium]
MTPQIYLIDDNPANQRLISWVVEGTKCQLHSYLDAETGLEACFAEPPDLVLLDIQLPGMNGEDACRTLKNDPRTANIPVIAVTANNMPGDEAYLLGIGFDAYLGKPITRLELTQLITRFLSTD